MKVFYAARVARFDLLRAVGHLSRFLTKWTDECDLRLDKLMRYIKTTLHYRMTGWVGDDIRSINLHLYADANFRSPQRRGTTHQLPAGGTLLDPNVCKS